jgi:hypothetical protein
MRPPRAPIGIRRRACDIRADSGYAGGEIVGVVFAALDQGAIGTLICFIPPGFAAAAIAARWG